MESARKIVRSNTRDRKSFSMLVQIPVTQGCFCSRVSFKDSKLPNQTQIIARIFLVCDTRKNG